MRRNKTQKGITLVALIITIIVLLILAVVAIRAVQGDGIISQAKNARDKYNEAQMEENGVIQNYTEYITGQVGGENPPVVQEDWTQNKTEVKNVKTNQVLTVGQTVTNYTAGGKTWKVLGAEAGKLLLMSTTNVKDSHTLTGSTAGWSTAENRFVGAEAELTQICKDTITDIGEAESIRSAKVEDINRVTGYNPAETGDGTPYGNGNTYQYGNEVTYSLNGEGKVAYASDVKSGTSSYTKFEMPDGTALTASAPMTIKSSSYYYYPHSLTTSSSTTEEIKGIAMDSEAYKLMFLKEDGTTKSNYWLASSFASMYEGYADFGVREVISGSVGINNLWGSDYGSGSNDDGVRPVVSLGSNFQPIV